jgi:hypothetical protein
VAGEALAVGGTGGNAVVGASVPSGATGGGAAGSGERSGGGVSGWLLKRLSRCGRDAARN